MNENYKKVIVALDYVDPFRAFELVDEVSEYVDWFKVGSVLFTRSGNEIIDFLHKRNKKIFLDLKLYDTPRVVRDTVRQICDLGVRFASVHCLGGHPMLSAASEGCRGSQLRLLGITLLTSQTADDAGQLGWPSNESDLVVRLLDLACHHRLAGIVCSPHEIEEVRSKAPPGMLLVTPGIRLNGKEVYQDDQKRVAAPTEALDKGADFLVIGRPITQAREPRTVMESLFDQ